MEGTGKLLLAVRQDPSGLVYYPLWWWQVGAAQRYKLTDTAGAKFLHVEPPQPATCLPRANHDYGLRVQQTMAACLVA